MFAEGKGRADHKSAPDSDLDRIADVLRIDDFMSFPPAPRELGPLKP